MDDSLSCKYIVSTNQAQRKHMILEMYNMTFFLHNMTEASHLNPNEVIIYTIEGIIDITLLGDAGIWFVVWDIDIIAEKKHLFTPLLEGIGAIGGVE